MPANAPALSLASYKGKPVVLAFILTYCGHCQKTVGVMTALNKEYAPRGVQMLAVAMEDMAAMAVPDFIKQFNPGFPVGFAFRDAVTAYLQHPPQNVMMMPQLVFLDRGFTIREQHSGDGDYFNAQERNIKASIEALLKAPAAKPAHQK